MLRIFKISFIKGFQKLSVPEISGTKYFLVDNYDSCHNPNNRKYNIVYLYLNLKKFVLVTVFFLLLDVRSHRNIWKAIRNHSLSEGCDHVGLGMICVETQDCTLSVRGIILGALTI